MVDSEVDHYSNVVKTDLDGTFYCAKAAAAQWRKQKKEGNIEGFRYGSFIATASMSGHIVNIPQLQAAYNAAKAGVIHLCTLASLLYDSGHHANDIQANPLLLNGFNLLAQTLFLRVTLQLRFPVSLLKTPKTSGKIKSPWAVKVRHRSSRVLTFTLPPTLLAIRLAPTSWWTGGTRCLEFTQPSLRFEITWLLGEALVCRFYRKDEVYENDARG